MNIHCAQMHVHKIYVSNTNISGGISIHMAKIDYGYQMMNTCNTVQLNVFDVLST